jgi:hypothetical protein
VRRLPLLAVAGPEIPTPARASRRVVWKDWVEPAQVASGIAAAVGLFLTAIGLFLTASQMRRNRQTADLQVLQKFFETANKHEYELVHAKDIDAWTYAFNEFLNFLEIHCAAYNQKQFGSGSKELVRHKLEDCYIELNRNQQCHPLIAKAVDRSTTFLEFRVFVQRNRKEIDIRAEQHG